jgi:hypothetical protein
MLSAAEVYSTLTLGQPRLEKVICHTNVAGDALFQRYNRCPWRVLSAAKPPNGKRAGSQLEEANVVFTFQDPFKNDQLRQANGPRSMELDRGTCAEFRTAPSSYPNTGAHSQSDIQLDFSTRLIGRDGLVLEAAKDGSIVGVVAF